MAEPTGQQVERNMKTHSLLSEHMIEINFDHTVVLEDPAGYHHQGSMCSNAKNSCTVHVCVAQYMVRAADWSLEDLSAIPSWISISFFSLIRAHIHIHFYYITIKYLLKMNYLLLLFLFYLGGQ